MQVSKGKGAHQLQALRCRAWLDCALLPPLRHDSFWPIIGTYGPYCQSLGWIEGHLWGGGGRWRGVARKSVGQRGTPDFQAPPCKQDMALFLESLDPEL